MQSVVEGQRRRNPQRGRWAVRRSAIAAAALGMASLSASGMGVPADGIPEDPAGWWSPAFVERLAQERRQLAEARAPVDLDDGLEEYRAVIHAHSVLSHDSRGTLADLVETAHATRTRAIFMTEHPSAQRDVYAEGWHGIQDGVLFVPGAETQNLLVWPRTRQDRWRGLAGQAFVDAVRDDGGLVVVCHQDTFRDWDLTGLHGIEIYNIHVDAKDEPQLGALFEGTPDFGLLVQMAGVFRDYPLESMAFILDDPDPWVRRWDELLRRGPITAIAGNDAHRNTGFVFRVGAGPAIEVLDALGEQIARLEPQQIPGLAAVVGRTPPGTELLRVQLDPYAASFGLAGTYLLAPELTEDALRHALGRGRAFVGFDWLADASGFTAVMAAGAGRWAMGDRVPLSDDLRLAAEAPLEAAWRLLRDGENCASGRGRTLDVPIRQTGVYRLELRLSLLGREWPWIYSNPFYVR